MKMRGKLMTNFEQFKKDIQTMSAEQFVDFIYSTHGFCQEQQNCCQSCCKCFSDWLNRKHQEQARDNSTISGYVFLKNDKCV